MAANYNNGALCASMVNNDPPAKNAESMSKSVQEMAISGQEPPARYCHRDGVGGSLDTSSLPVLEIPIIDFDLLASPSSSRQELQKLHAALSSFGCFMSINHGMSSSYLDNVRSVTKQFFALPMEEKRKYCGVDGIEGYGTMILSNDQVHDWNDRLHLIVSPEKQRQLNLWPENPLNFRETLFEYTAKLQLIIEVVLKAMAISLNLEEQCFLDKCGVKATMRARFNLFPPCSRHDQVLGLSPHSDPSVITIVLQDKQVEGLQFLKDDQWFRVPIVPEAFLINIGEQGEILSNGLFRSPVHRVVINPERDRFSLAVFYYPDADNYIEPADGLVDETRPRLYKKVKNYIGSYLQHYNKEKRMVEALKIYNF